MYGGTTYVLFQMIYIYTKAYQICNMCPDTGDVENTKNPLFNKIKQEYGKRGIYGVEMLEAANKLLEQNGSYPRQAEMAAYCIRQALVEIFRGFESDREPWRVVSRRVVQAKNTLMTDADWPNVDLKPLFKTINDLEDWHKGETTNESRFIETIRYKTGVAPTSGNNSTLNTYKGLLDQLNDKFVHKVSQKRGNLGDVRDYYRQAIDMLEIIHLPPRRRLAEIKNLAHLNTPKKGDMVKLKRIMLNRYHFDYFASKVNSPDWFDLLGSDMPKSYSDKSPWLLSYLALHLKYEHADAFLHMVETNFDRWFRRDAGPVELGYAAYKLENRGIPWLVKMLKKSKQMRQQRDKVSHRHLEDTSNKIAEDIRVDNSVVQLYDYARLAFLDAKSVNAELIELGDILLDSDTHVDNYGWFETISSKLVDIMNSRYSIKVIEILTRMLSGQQRLNHWTVFRTQSIASTTTDYPHDIDFMVGNLYKALKKTSDSNIPTIELVKTLDMLPDSIRPRFVAWLYSYVNDVDRFTLVDFIVCGCDDRNPTDDDGLLLDKMMQDGNMDNDTTSQLKATIGDAPEPAKLVGPPNQWGLDGKKYRHILWARMLRRTMELSNEWKLCLSVVDKYYDAEGDTPNYISRYVLNQEDIIESDSEDPLIIADKISTGKIEGRGTPIIGLYMIMSKLEEMVRNNPSKWAENPVEIVKTLKHPIYVERYFKSLSGTKDALSSHNRNIISAIHLVRKYHLDTITSETSNYQDSVSWEMAYIAGMDLIKNMVENKVYFDENSLSNIWLSIIEAMIYQVQKPSGFDIPLDIMKTRMDIPYSSHTIALEIMLHLISYVRQRHEDIPDEAMAKLTTILGLTGRVGVEYRIILGMWYSFIRLSLPDWFQQNESRIFGRAAPNGLGQFTLDWHLRMGQPDETVLVKYRDGVLNAVGRDVDGAMEHLLVGMLLPVDGYAPKFIANQLVKIGYKHVSWAGKSVARILRDDVDPGRIQRGVDFWKHVLGVSAKPEALVGFGWWVEVKNIKQGQWEELTLRMCEVTGVKPELSFGIAERISTCQTISDKGFQILELLVRANLDAFDHEVYGYALDALRRTVDVPDTESRRHLRDALLEHGFNEANEL